jgi:hypothetical protein
VSKEIGTLNIYKLSSAQIDAIVSKFCSEIVFKGLTTDFVKLDKFLQKMGNERHTGYIEVFSKGNEIMGTLFLKDGELVDLHLPSESENSSLSEPQAIPVFLEDVIRQGAFFDVYRSFMENVPARECETVTTIGKETENEGDDVRAENKEEPHQELDETLVSDEVINENDAKDRTFSTNGREHVLDALQEVITKTEKFVDGFSQGGIFLRAFKRALIEKSDLYPFLDPFMGQFDYRQGEITLDEAIELEHLATGIADCFNLTLSHLKKEFPKHMNFSPNLKAEFESKFKIYEDAMKESGVRSVPPMFFK